VADAGKVFLLGYGWPADDSGLTYSWIDEVSEAGEPSPWFEASGSLTFFPDAWTFLADGSAVMIGWGTSDGSIDGYALHVPPD
jgi:hypothetical protein